MPENQESNLLEVFMGGLILHGIVSEPIRRAPGMVSQSDIALMETLCFPLGTALT